MDADLMAKTIVRPYFRTRAGVELLPKVWSLLLDSAKIARLSAASKLMDHRHENEYETNLWPRHCGIFGGANIFFQAATDSVPVQNN